MQGTAVRTGITRLTLGLQVLSLAGVAPMFGAAPRTVSPGGAARFVAAAAACPTFSWAALPGSVEVELVVYAVVGEAEPALAAQPAMSVRLPGGASSWTPAAESCLAPGRYAWAVRGQSAGEDEVEGAAASASWSEALLFEVRERPTTQELENALDVVRRHLAAGGELASAAPATAAAGTDRRRDLRREPTDNVREELARGESTDLPERVASAAGSEPNLVLGGTPVARLAASDFRRESDDPMVFDFHNPGVGTMTLRVDGVDVVTTATDQDTTYLPGNQLQLTGTTFDVVEGSGSGLDADLLDGQDSAAFVTVTSDPYVDETGDTMSGLLTIDPASGFALQTGAGDSIDLGGDVFQGGVVLLHTPGSSSTGVGLGALDAVSSGDLSTALGRDALGAATIGVRNTAIGAYALDANTGGSSNTAVGASALGANVAGSLNTAVGRSALLANTASNNTALGAYALDANTTGPNNTAVGFKALLHNVTGAYNTAVGHSALFTNTASNNTALGAYALAAGVTGPDNTAVGRSALLANTASSNTALGAFALVANMSGSANTAVGRSALGANVTGASNTAVGRSALAANTASSNTALGSYALDANTSGTSNTAVGRSALGANVTAGFSTAVGYFALAANTASNNTALGSLALYANTTGTTNTAVGSEALRDNVAGGSNTAIGRGALLVNTASSNTALGADALDANTSGASNTAVGRSALGANVTGSSNTAVGRNALVANTASGNTALGSYALDANTSGTSNTAVGRNALGANVSGTRDTAVGTAALLTATAGFNTALGAYALDANTSGTSNTAVGNDALGGNTTGAGNIALGNTAGINLTTGSDNIVIGNSGVADESAKIRIGVAGTQTETFIAGIHGNTVTSGTAVFALSTGELGTLTSSRRFKDEIADIGASSERLLGLRPVSFRYRPEALGSGADAERGLEFGLIAEEVAEVFPELVVYDESGAPYTVRYHLLIPLLLAELQREHRENVAQHAELEALRQRIEENGR